jgi:hypothetical protein
MGPPTPYKDTSSIAPFRGGEIPTRPLHFFAIALACDVAEPQSDMPANGGPVREGEDGRMRGKVKSASTRAYDTRFGSWASWGRAEMLAILTTALVATMGCEARIAARDPQALRAHDEVAERARTPWPFPTPDEPPGGTPRPDSSPTARPSAGPTASPGSDPSATPTPDSSPTPSGTPSTARATQLTPPEAKAYKLGDELLLRVKFDKPVLWTGAPTVVLKEGTQRFAFEPILGLSSDTHTYRYVVAAGDQSGGGLTLEPKFDLSAGSLQEREGGAVEDALPSDVSFTGITLDGIQERAVRVVLPPAGAYGDTLDVMVEFAHDVTLRGTPSLQLLVDTDPPSATGALRQAPAVAASGKTVTFRYTVMPDDKDLLDGVRFSRDLQPGSAESQLDVVMGSNGNPVADSLADAAWTGGPVKVGRELPLQTLYAHFKVERERLSETSPCAAMAFPWSGGSLVGCWLNSLGGTIRLEGAAAAGTTPESRPALTLSGTSFSVPALTFGPAGPNDGEKSLRFPMGASPVTAGSRFVVIAFEHANAGAVEVPLLWLDPNRAIVFSPAENAIRLFDGTMLAPGSMATQPRTALVNATLPANTPLIVGLADDGVKTTLLQWIGSSATRRDAVVTPSGGATNAFAWTLDAATLGGRLQPGLAAFQGNIAEVLVYGALTTEEQARVLCVLAKRHLGFGGECFL